MSRRQPSLATPAARRAWLGVVFVVVMVELLGWNVLVIRRNQKRLGPDETPRRRPGNIVTVAMQNPADVVRYFLATFYYLRVLAGKTLVIPARFAEYRLFFERVSRVHVEVAPRSPRLAPLSAMRLEELVERRYFLGAGTALDVVLAPAADRYVMAGGVDRDYLILPEPLYQRELAANPLATAAPAAAPPPAPTPTSAAALPTEATP